MNQQKLTIGLIGYGVVGQGLHYVLQKAPNANAEIVKVCDNDRTKTTELDEELLCTDWKELLQHQDINLIVELINNPETAFQIVKESLQNGKNVVSANKKMLAHHLPELIEIQNETGSSLLYDASACGSIPVIRNLEECYNNDLLTSVTGILNGSSNYILSSIFKRAESYPKALKKAQQLGFAETDPSADVGGYDALYKLVIICLHSFGLYLHPDEIFRYGISGINDFDIRFAKEKSRKIKLTASVKLGDDKKVSLYVIPRLVTSDEYIYNVEDEYNGVVIQGEGYDKQFMFGKGAGSLPTGSAVLSDITALTHNYRYEYKKQHNTPLPQVSHDALIKLYVRYENVIDLSAFDFEEIKEKYNGEEGNYVIGTIRLSSLKNIQKLLEKMHVFVAEI